MDRKNSASSMGSALRKVESYQYPATHVGHLSDEQRGALQSFKSLAADKGYYKPESAASGTKASHDDETLLRYLRARKFAPTYAFNQFKDTEDWRKQNKIDELYETIDVWEYDETRKLYPQWTGRRDKRGIPVYVFEVASLTSKRMAEYDKAMSEHGTKTQGTTAVPPKMLRLFALYENLIKFVLPLCSGIPNRPYAETPVSQSNNIVDIAGVGLKQFWNLRQHMQDASQLATAHYPETLDRIFIIGAPSFFPTVWSWIKAWFDPITVSKIFILSKENVQSTLEQYMDPENIPKKYGGKLDWEWGHLPSLEPAIANSLAWENPAKGEDGQNCFPAGPVKWRETPVGDMNAYAVGSVKGQKRNDFTATLPVHDLELNLGPAMSVDVVRQELLKTPTTAGVHTHPADDEEYFPRSGYTPPSEPEEASLSGSLRSDKAVGAESVAVAADKALETAPAAAGEREGTSVTRLEQQKQTHASGQMADGTPAFVDHGYGDKTVTVEPSTVGQALKNVEIPEAQPEEQQEGYLDKAKAAATSAYSSATAALETVRSTAMNAAGYGEETNQSEETQPQEKVEATPKEDPRVDSMEDKDIEDYLRSKYAASQRTSEGKVA